VAGDSAIRNRFFPLQRLIYEALSPAMRASHPPTAIPRARGLALGYTLAPATRASHP
jgi:hypothetical protein